MARVRLAVGAERLAERSDVTVDVTVRGIAAGGSGVADLPDGRVVFVPRTAPGDHASVRIERSKARWATGSLHRILEPSPERREPPCVLYDVCGGCQLQHLPYARQLEWKARFVKDALVRIGGLDVADTPPIHLSPRELHYRNRVSFTLRRLGKGRVVAGFHALDRPGRIVDVRSECLLPVPRLLDAWVAIRRGWGDGARLLPRGERLRLTVREESGGVMLVVEGGSAPWDAEPLLRTAAPHVAAIWHRPDERAGAVRLAAGSPDVGSPAFAQVNADVAEAMAGRVLALADAAAGAAAGPGRAVVDAYSGSGRYARRLHGAGWKVTAIELDGSACDAARKASGDAYPVLEGRVEDLLPGALPADLLVVNPPRAGLGAEVVGAILHDPPERLVYVSCDPATLARDAAALARAFELQSVECFDLFPQTAHVETVCALGRVERMR